MDPQGRIAVVTGAAGGIGGALVDELVATGAKTVVAVDLAEPQTSSPAVVTRSLDVSDEKATQALVDDIEHSMGPIDLWFANAGISGGAGPDAPDSIWERQWQVNVMGHVIAARVLLPLWVARGEGHLITTASVAGLLTTLGDAVYAATKHAAVGFAEWVAITYGAQGVHVSCVCPGAVDTNMLRGAIGDAGTASKAIGGGDVLTPAEAARRIVAATKEDRFLILTHPEMHDLIVKKANEPDRWIRGMQKLWTRTQELLAEQ